MATGQFIRWSFSTIAGVFQAFLLNGPTTNTDDCSISWENCWSWGLSVREYYGLLSICICILFIPMCYLKESDPNLVRRHTFSDFLYKIWVIYIDKIIIILYVNFIGYCSKSNNLLSNYICCRNS